VLERLLLMVRRALRNIRQSPVLCGAAVGTVAVSLSILAFFGVLAPTTAGRRPSAIFRPFAAGTGQPTPASQSRASLRLSRVVW
jgi:hypothetical protein